MRPLLLLTALLIAVGVGSLALWWTRTPADTPRAGAEPVAETDEPPRVPAEPLSDVRSRDPNLATSSDGRATIPAPAPPPDPQGLEETLAAPQPSADFTWKYGSSDRAARELALASVREELSARLDELAISAFEEGRYEVLTAAENVLAKAQTMFGDNGVLFRARATAVTPDQEPPALEVASSIEVVTFPESDFPELYELDGERRWLEHALSVGAKR